MTPPPPVVPHSISHTPCAPHPVSHTPRPTPRVPYPTPSCSARVERTRRPVGHKHHTAARRRVWDGRTPDDTPLPAVATGMCLLSLQACLRLQCTLLLRCWCGGRWESGGRVWRERAVEVARVGWGAHVCARRGWGAHVCARRGWGAHVCARSGRG
eukprot:366279-Chlamydomonas_euryale.AAC.13